MSKGDWLGDFELCVMLAVAHLGGDAYGVSVRRHIEETTGRAVTIGAIYTTLGRLEEKGLDAVSSDRVPNPSPAAGRGRSSASRARASVC